MKLAGTDIGGFSAILVAGFLAGKDSEKGTFSNTDLFIIIALLGLGFYLAVTLS